MRRDWLGELGRMSGLLPEAELRRHGVGPLLSLLREARDSEWIPVAELESRQRMQLRALARHAVRHSPHFAKRMLDAGLGADDLGEPGGLQRLPPMGRVELMRAGEEFFCREVPPGHGAVGESMTSGSTGEPVVVRRTARARAHWLAAGLRERLWMGRDCAGDLAVVRANADAAQECEDWGPPYSMLFRTGRASVRPASTPVEQLASWLEEKAADEWLVLPSCLAGILESLRQMGRVVRTPALVRTLSETVSNQLRDTMRQRFGVEIQDSYSSQEFGLMAIQCPVFGAYHVLEQVIVEVVNDEGGPCAPGEVGRLLVTDFINFASPMIRYDIGDLAEAGAPCGCGRPHRTLRRILGRERNLIRLPDGSRHWPRFGFHRWGDVHPVRQFQFVQIERDVLVGRLRVDRIPSRSSAERLAEIVRESLGHPLEIRFEWHTEALPRGRGGKFEEFTCLVSG